MRRGESSIRDAFFQDYQVVKDGVAGFFQQLHENSLAVMGKVFAEVKTVEEIMKS